MCIAKDEDHYIEEWCNYHLKLGFDDIIIYQNDWKCKINHPNIILVDFPGKHKQVKSYNDFISKYKNDYDWVAFIDCDEFIHLKKHSNIKEFILEYHNEFGISMNWYMFGSNNKLVRDNENKNSLIKQFTFRDKDVNHHIKTLLNLKSESTMSLPHNPSNKLMDTNRNFFRGPFNPNGPTDIIQLNHYYYKTYEDWLILCNRGQSDYTPTKTPKIWLNNIHVSCDVEDCGVYNFMYKKN
jgi:adenylate kinase family enzyme